jgi:hypothetical protein
MTALLPTFVLGVGNFALHKAVLESRHPMLGPLLRHAPRPLRALGGRATLLVEFAILLGAMLLAGLGNPGWTWVYAGYTGLNALAAWLILTRRV